MDEELSIGLSWNDQDHRLFPPTFARKNSAFPLVPLDSQNAKDDSLDDNNYNDEGENLDGKATETQNQDGDFLSELERQALIVNTLGRELESSFEQEVLSVESHNTLDENSIQYIDETSESETDSLHKVLDGVLEIESELAAKTNKSTQKSSGVTGTSSHLSETVDVSADTGKTGTASSPNRHKSIHKVKEFSGGEVEFVQLWLAGTSTLTQTTSLAISAEKTSSSKGVKRGCAKKQEKEKKPKLYQGDPANPRVARSLKQRNYRTKQKDAFEELKDKNQQLETEVARLKVENQQLKARIYFTVP